MSRFGPPPVIGRLEKRLETIKACDDYDYKFSMDIIGKFRRNPNYEMSDKQFKRVQGYVDKYALPKREMPKPRSNRYGINCKR